MNPNARQSGDAESISRNAMTISQITEQIKALAEVLSDGLQEVNDSDSEAGWALSDETGAILSSRSVSPAKVSSEVFSKQALTTRNRRIKIR